ncbi:hypothetical protein OROMI_031612 [Orobanche minor]
MVLPEAPLLTITSLDIVDLIGLPKNRGSYDNNEIASRQPEESGHMQMTDTLCKRCSQRPVTLLEIIQIGHGDRYQRTDPGIGPKKVSWS